MLGGFNKIPQHLGKHLKDVRFNERVTSIDYSGAKIKVTHNQKVSEADYVVVTVPLGVLKSGKLEFIPAWPTAKTEALQRLEMNCVNKFTLIWPQNIKRFWPKDLVIADLDSIYDMKYTLYFNLGYKDPTIKALMTFSLQ
jgi:monoamine oxidase